MSDKSTIEKEARLKRYKILIDSVDDNNYLASAPELIGCKVRAKSRSEALQLIENAIRAHIKKLEENNLPIPIPFSEKKFSGKVMIRITSQLHQEIALKAQLQGLSMNRFIEDLLKKD